MTSHHDLSIARAAAADERRRMIEVTRLAASDDFETATAKILEAFAFCPTLALVFPIYSASMNSSMNIVSFRQMMMPWARLDVGPRGGLKNVNPVDIWLAAPMRKTVQGLQMRPDQPTPVFEAKDGLWLNTYAPPEHLGKGGTTALGFQLLEHLLPDSMERDYFLNWLAHKYQHPEVPGPAILMVARRHGTGRGTLGELLKRLFGPGYVRSIPFHLFAGKSYQSQYNDWGSQSLLVLVNESSDGGAHPYASKRDTYEHLKDIVEPRSIERTYVTKGRNAFTAPSFTSFLVATNHADALPLPADDRRFAVLQNGEPAPPSFWSEFDTWLNDPANVSAFARYLERHQTAGYSPYERPPMTAAKEVMAELSASDLDQAYDLALDRLPGRLVTPRQVVQAISAVKSELEITLPDYWDVAARKLVQSRLHRVGTRHGANWMIQIDRVKHPTYARTQKEAAAWTRKPAELVRVEVMRNEPPTPSLPEKLAGLARNPRSRSLHVEGNALRNIVASPTPPSGSAG